MTNLGFRDGGKPRRRTFAPAEKLELLSGYEEAIRALKGGAFLSDNGMYSSQITEWRKLRDAGVLKDVNTGPQDEELSVENAEIIRLRRELKKSENQLKKTEDALEILGKLSAFFDLALKTPDDERKI